jgi:hypothetical protein
LLDELSLLLRYGVACRARNRVGYTPMSGAQMRYNVYAGEQLVACISFGASAWKLKERERFIGWQEYERKKICNWWSTTRAS